MTNDGSRNDGDKSPGRGPGKPFQKGNPGKPKGALSRVTRVAQDLLDGNAKKLTTKAIDLALAGDTVALRICMERLLPPRKDRPIQFDLPRIETLDDASKAVAAILTGVAAGQITPAEAGAVVPLIEGFVRAIEAHELERRIIALEARA
jgi:hypothetical protein